ncbi:hypothetical protein Tco_0024924 [Tanacetum coccineum]
MQRTKKLTKIEKQESKTVSKTSINVEETSSKHVAIDGAGFFPEFEGYGPKTSKNVSEDTSNEVRESPDALMVEKLVSDDKIEKKIKQFYINKHSKPSDRDAVRSYMRILSVISIKTYERYGYNYMREIVLRRADYNEYKISEKHFKSLHPNDFEDLNILHIQGKLDHLPEHDKVNLHNAVNLWTRNIVIRKRMEDLQLGIERYQTKLNLEQPNWDASDFPFKEDYTIVFKPRAVIYRDMDDNRKMMRINEVHKFSDGTLIRIKEKLDFMVKDFKLFKFNKGMENRKWTKDDKRRSEDFIEDTYPILLSSTHCGNKSILRVLRIILVILPEHPSETKVLHNEDGNPARANIKQALGSYERPHKGVKASANSDIVYFFTSAQDGDPLQDDVRLCLGDDLKKAQDHNQRQVKDESKDHYPKCTRYQMSTS